MKTIILWLTMVFILSVYPLKAGTVTFDNADKLLHFIIYCITCLLFYVTLRPKVRSHALLLSVALASIYGLAMEGAQHFTGYRSFSMFDALANFLGACAGAAYLIIRRPRAGRAHK